MPFGRMQTHTAPGRLPRTGMWRDIGTKPPPANLRTREPSNSHFGIRKNRAWPAHTSAHRPRLTGSTELSPVRGYPRRFRNEAG